MYVTTPYNTAIAYDLTTKKEIWRYEHKLGTTIYCCGPNNRGFAIHGGAHLYMGTLDAHLVALDAKDGKVLWDKEVADPAFGYSITHAPLIIGDNVIVGVSGGEYGIRGHVTAYNAMTGDQVWRWYSIPAPKGDSTFDDKAPNGWFGTWPTSTPDGADLHRDVDQGEGRQRQVRRRLEDRRRRRLDDSVVRQGVEHPLPDGRQPVTGPGRQHPSGRQPLHRLHRRHRRHVGQDQVVLPDGAARRLGPRRDLAAGRRRRWAARRSWCTRARPAGSTCSTPAPASWSAGATPSCRRRTCSPCRRDKGTRMLPGANGGAEWSPDRDRSDASATRSSRRCTSR